MTASFPDCRVAAVVFPSSSRSTKCCGDPFFAVIAKHTVLWRSNQLFIGLLHPIYWIASPCGLAITGRIGAMTGKPRFFLCNFPFVRFWKALRILRSPVEASGQQFSEFFFQHLAEVALALVFQMQFSEPSAKRVQMLLAGNFPGHFQRIHRIPVTIIFALFDG